MSKKVRGATLGDETGAVHRTHRFIQQLNPLDRLYNKKNQQTETNRRF